MAIRGVVKEVYIEMDLLHNCILKRAVSLGMYENCHETIFSFSRRVLDPHAYTFDLNRKDYTQEVTQLADLCCRVESVMREIHEIYTDLLHVLKCQVNRPDDHLSIPDDPAENVQMKFYDLEPGVPLHDLDKVMSFNLDLTTIAARIWDVIECTNKKANDSFEIPNKEALLQVLRYNRLSTELETKQYKNMKH